MPSPDRTPSAASTTADATATLTAICPRCDKRTKMLLDFVCPTCRKDAA